MAHTCNPVATGEAEIGRIKDQGQPGEMVSKTPISTNKKLFVLSHACHPNYVGKISVIQAGPSIKVRPYLKNS
jgi:hypothetical protein